MYYIDKTLSSVHWMGKRKVLDLFLSGMRGDHKILKLKSSAFQDQGLYFLQLVSPFDRNIWKIGIVFLF